MKGTHLIIIAAVAAEFGFCMGSNAGVANGSFESANLDGWRLDMARGSSYTQRNRAAGTAMTLTEWGSDYDLSPLQAAVAGSRFATIGTLANGNFTGNRTYHISLSQKLSLESGDKVTGWASFFNGDFEAQDSAWVKITDSEGNQIATPWSKSSGCSPENQNNPAPFQVLTPWTQWTWQAPTDGNFNLSIGVTTHGDDNYASYGFFDNILVVPASLPVPEPTTLSLVVAGLASLVARRRIIR